MDALLAELCDQRLRDEVISLCEEVASADGHGSDDERRVIEAARARWLNRATA